MHSFNSYILKLNDYSFLCWTDTQKAHSLFKFGQSHDPSDDTTGDADKQNVDRKFHI